MNKPEVSQPINMQSAAEMGTEEYRDISWVSNRQINRLINFRYPR